MTLPEWPFGISPTNIHIIEKNMTTKPFTIINLHIINY